MPTLAALVVPLPSTYTPPRVPAAVDTINACDDLVTFWARSQRADWMAYFLGWHRCDLQAVNRVVAGFLRQEAHRLPADDGARRALTRIHAGEPYEWTGVFEEDHVGDPHGAHALQAAIQNVAQVAGRGHTLGPSLPFALGDAFTWVSKLPDPDGADGWQRRGADYLRDHVPSSLVAQAVPPRRAPRSLQEARALWPSLWDEG